MVRLYVDEEDVSLASLQVVEEGLLVSLSVFDLAVKATFGLLQSLPLFLR